MKPIEKDELFSHLGNFLKAKGIELKDGSYSQSIQTGCSILADTINLGQQGIERAKVEVDKRLEQMRQIIHEKTAPKTSGKATPSTSASSGAKPPPTKTRAKQSPSPARSKPQTRKRKRA